MHKCYIIYGMLLSFVFAGFVFVVVFSLSTTVVIRLHLALFPAIHTDNVSRNSIVHSDQVHHSSFNQVTMQCGVLALCRGVVVCPLVFITIGILTTYT